MVCDYMVLKLIHEAIKNFVVIAEHPAHSLKEFMGKVAEVIFCFPQKSPILSTRSHNKPEGLN